MENTAKWNIIQKTIDEVIQEYEKSDQKSSFYGPSLATAIYNTLKSKGFLKEPENTS